MVEVGRDRVDLGEEHEDAERDRERDDQVLAPPQLQHGLGACLREQRPARHDRSSAVICRNTSSSERLPDCKATSVMS